MAEAQDRINTDRAGGRRSPDEIRADIERTRTDMHETVDALGQRLSAGQIFDEIWHRMRSGSGGDGAGIVKEHPVPLALMGLGLGWLAVEKATDNRAHHTDRSTATPHETTGAAYGSTSTPPSAFLSEDGAHAPGVKDKAREKASEFGDRVSSKAHDAKERVSGKAHEATDRVRHAASSAGERASEAATSARESARNTMQRARSGFDRLSDEQPLALGAIAFGLGIAAGMAAPTSRWEDEHLGDVSDRIKDTARHTAEELKHSAEEVAGEVRMAAKEATREAKHALEESARETEGRSAGQRVGEAIDRTADTVRRVAERHELDQEGLRMRADEAHETAREGAREMRDEVGGGEGDRVR